MTCTDKPEVPTFNLDVAALNGWAQMIDEYVNNPPVLRYIASSMRIYALKKKLGQV